jgi:hypothetical protein
MAAPLFPSLPTATTASPRQPLSRPALAAVVQTLTDARNDLEIQGKLVGRPDVVADLVAAMDRRLALLESDLADLDMASERLAVVDGLVADALPVKPTSVFSAEANRAAREQEELVRQMMQADTAEMARLYPETVRELSSGYREEF